MLDAGGSDDTARPRGVPVDELCCPTCGEPFDLTVRRDGSGADWLITAPIPPVTIPSEPAYLVCSLGHAWTMKLLIRSPDAPDEILLDSYLGDR